MAIHVQPVQASTYSPMAQKCEADYYWSITSKTTSIQWGTTGEFTNTTSSDQSYSLSSTYTKSYEFGVSTSIEGSIKSEILSLIGTVGFSINLTLSSKTSVSVSDTSTVTVVAKPNETVRYRVGSKMVYGNADWMYLSSDCTRNKIKSTSYKYSYGIITEYY